MLTAFKTFELKNEIVQSLNKMGYEHATAVQSQVIPLALKKGKDIIVKSKTGSGKTAAFAIPILQHTEKRKFPQALVLTPTRELAIQVKQEFKDIAKGSGQICEAVYGQHDIQKEVKYLKEGVDIIVGTPGRVIDHLKQNHLDLSEIKYLVLDEADKMLEMGFIDQVKKIIAQAPVNRTTMLFSATMPEKIQIVADTYMKNPQLISLASETLTVENVSQSYYRVRPDEKRFWLRQILKEKTPSSCIIFCNTRLAVDRVCSDLNQKGFKAEAIHGAMTQNKRIHAINHFKKSKFDLLVATDVAARGIHVDNLQLVINYDFPNDTDSYVHRIGRTGRAGQEGEAISFITSNEVRNLYDVEEYIGEMIEEKELPSVTQTKRKEVKQASKISSFSFEPQRVVKVGDSVSSVKPEVEQVLQEKQSWWKKLLSRLIRK